MADFSYDPARGHDGFGMGDDAAQADPVKALTSITNIAGAVVSLALIAGLGTWSYKLIVRDVSGIPVVRAAEGEMRVRPENPGGELALNQGLAVNAVAAIGVAEAPADRLTLAPRPMALTPSDLATPQATPATVASAQQSQKPADAADDIAADVAASLDTDAVAALVARLSDGVPAIDAPVEVQASVKTATVQTAAAQPSAVPAATLAVLNAPGVKASLRPQLRPASAPAVVQAARTVSTPTVRDIDAASLPAGTRLVQLGAFDSADIARSQWGKVRAQFGDYMSGKARIVQEAQSGGRTFYRLRAHGFADLSDARRFCSALLAEGADCIPVVTR